MSDLSPLAYHRELTCEFNAGTFLHCKKLKGSLCALGPWHCKSYRIAENKKLEADSIAETCFL